MLLPLETGAQVRIVSLFIHVYAYLCLSIKANACLHTLTRRKFMELGVSQSVVSRIVGSDGLINFLPILPPEDIPMGIRYIRSLTDEV